jgi:hypothetical protein
MVWIYERFCLPCFLEVFRKPRSVKFDHQNIVTKPFQILAGGYQIIFKNNRESQVFGSSAKTKRFGKEDRRGHRSETREEGELKRADMQRLLRHKLTTAAVAGRAG